MKRRNIVGTRIAYHRRRSGLTQKEIADRLDVSIQAASKWENGISCPDILLLPRLADLFEVTIDDLFENANGKD